ncbi:MAG: endonuclease/exonuclease/phosphatase family protein [Pseudomonadota bacterium]
MRGAEDIDHVLTRMAEVDADVWVLQGVDYDLGEEALSRFAAEAGYPHSFAKAPNSGLRSGTDLDGDGRAGRPRDSQSFGWFSGQGGMAVLSRFPLSLRADRSELIWSEIPWATPPETMTAEARAIQRLSSTAHWALDVATPGGPLTVITAHVTPPVFDGPEDRNGLRNADEIRLLAEMLEASPGPAIVAGNFNLDPGRGEGRREEIARLLSHPRLQDPLPGAVTVDFGPDSAGRLRVSYVLPTRDVEVRAAAVGALPAGAAATDIERTRHAPVWVDISVPSGG